MKNKYKVNGKYVVNLTDKQSSKGKWKIKCFLQNYDEKAYHIYGV